MFCGLYKFSPWHVLLTVGATLDGSKIKLAARPILAATLERKTEEDLHRKLGQEGLDLQCLK